MPETDIKKSTILVVDDEQDHAQVMCEALSRLGHKCDVTFSLAEARAKLDRKDYDVVVTDLVMEGNRDGLEVLRRARQKEPPPPVLLVTAHADIPTCKQALNEGAYDYIEKPLDLEYFRAQVNRAAERAALQKQNIALQAQLLDNTGFDPIVGSSAGMQRVIRTARQVAQSDIPVLILGESGTGKELFARAIHNTSRRRKQRLVALNCAGFAPTILEDELFGHVRGAYTGANTDREGRFEHADRGTLFLDEIGDMPQEMQAKLLRVLESGEVVRLGSNEPRHVDVRLISATNKKLDEMVADKTFREDLYFRIKGVTLQVPALRERREDIPLLIHYFLQQAAEKYGKEVDGLRPETQQVLMSYGWPGNVRELKQVVENLVVLSPGPLLGPESLPPEIRPAAGELSVGGMNNLVGISITQAEKELIRNTLKLTDGNREQAAKILGIGERTLYRKIKEYDLRWRLRFLVGIDRRSPRQRPPSSPPRSSRSPRRPSTFGSPDALPRGRAGAADQVARGRAGRGVPRRPRDGARQGGGAQLLPRTDARPGTPRGTEADPGAGQAHGAGLPDDAGRRGAGRAATRRRRTSARRPVRRRQGRRRRSGPPDGRRRPRARATAGRAPQGTRAGARDPHARPGRAVRRRPRLPRETRRGPMREIAPKITVPLEVHPLPFRVGHGYDLHRTRPGGRMMLGGVCVSEEIGVVAHSDGDVVIHAIVDALLGAMGWGDIGEHFSDADPRWRGAASTTFLDAVFDEVRRVDYDLLNLDLTIQAERPRLKPFKPQIVQYLTDRLGGQVNVKAGTNEGCDAIGRGEAVAAHAVVLLSLRNA